MLIDFNNEEWKYIHATLVHDLMDNRDTLSFEAIELQEALISRIEARLGL